MSLNPPPNQPYRVDDLHRFLNQWQRWSPQLKQQPKPIKALSQGRTNLNWQLQSDCGDLVLRINHPQSTLLGINRNAEQHILQAIAPLNIAPSLIYTDPNQQYNLFKYIEGTSWDTNSIKQPINQQKLRVLIERYQAINVSAEPRNYSHYLESYLQQLNPHQLKPHHLTFEEWEALQSFMNQLRLDREKQKGVYSQACLTHHDLIPENILEDSQGKLYILDWEYAALGCGELDYLSIGLTKKSHSPEAVKLLKWLNTLWHCIQYD